MSYAKGTEHYNLPLTEDTDVRTWDDTNECFKAIDEAIFNANSASSIEQIYETSDDTFQNALEAISDKILSTTNMSNFASTKLIFEIKTTLSVFPSGTYLFNCEGMCNSAVNFATSYVYKKDSDHGISTTYISIVNGKDVLMVGYDGSNGGNYGRFNFSGKIYFLQ